MNRINLKMAAKNNIQGNLGNLFLAGLVLMLISICFAIPFIGTVAGIILGPILLFSYRKIYYNLVKTNKQPDVGDLFTNMQMTFKILGLYLLVGLIIGLGFLLIVPGIIFALMYSQCTYIMADNPEMSITECMQTSRIMMQGHKGELFVLVLSFFGWYLLGLMTFHILTVIYVIPYYHTTLAHYFFYLKDSYIKTQSQTPYNYNPQAQYNNQQNSQPNNQNNTNNANPSDNGNTPWEIK